MSTGASPTPGNDPLRPPGPQGGSAPDETEEYFKSQRGKLVLWVGVLGGGVAWSVQMQTGYALARFSHAVPWLTAVHHAVSLLGALAALGAMLLAYREWRRLGGGEPAGVEGGVSGRARFMAMLGIVTSGLFALVIVAQWVPVFFIKPAWY